MLTRALNTTEEEKKAALSRDRSDFVRRLFAVAVSVGFASHIDHFKWLADFSTPPRDAALLFAAMVFVVASWDGYLRSLQADPLTDLFRFVLDIIIVFEYLLLMTFSNNIYSFTRFVCVIYFTYIIWDYVKVLHFREKYRVKNWFDGVVKILSRLLTRDRDIMGSSITIWWTIYFVALDYTKEGSSSFGFASCVILLIYGAILYRVDKTERLNPYVRLALVVIPILISTMVKSNF